MNREHSIYVRELIGITSFAISLYLTRKIMTDPDFARTLYMRTMLIVKSSAQKQADMWQRIATNAATSYNKAKI